MINWRDDNGNLTDVLYGFYSGTSVAPNCCGNPDVHFYVHRFRLSSERGSAWVWCSNCKKYVHLDGFSVAANINNCADVDSSKLCAVPDYLEQMKSIIDLHNTSINN